MDVGTKESERLIQKMSRLLSQCNEKLAGQIALTVVELVHINEDRARNKMYESLCRPRSN